MLFGTVTVPEIVPLLPEDLLLQGGPGVEGENVLLTQVDQLLPVEHTNSVSVTNDPSPIWRIFIISSLSRHGWAQIFRHAQLTEHCLGLSTHLALC